MLCFFIVAEVMDKNETNTDGAQEHCLSVQLFSDAITLGPQLLASKNLFRTARHKS